MRQSASVLGPLPRWASCRTSLDRAVAVATAERAHIGQMETVGREAVFTRKVGCAPRARARRPFDRLGVILSHRVSLAEL